VYTSIKEGRLYNVKPYAMPRYSPVIMAAVLRLKFGGLSIPSSPFSFCYASKMSRNIKHNSVYGFYTPKICGAQPQVADKRCLYASQTYRFSFPNQRQVRSSYDDGLFYETVTCAPAHCISDDRRGSRPVDCVEL